MTRRRIASAAHVSGVASPEGAPCFALRRRIGTELAVKAPADGYNLLMGSSTEIAINPHLYKKLSYDTLRDFAPVTHVASTPLLIVVHPSLPAKTVKEFVALARARPGQLFGASSSS